MPPTATTTAAPTTVTVDIPFTYKTHSEDGAGMMTTIVVCGLVFVFIGFVCFLMRKGGNSTESGAPPPTQPEDQVEEIVFSRDCF